MVHGLNVLNEAPKTLTPVDDYLWPTGERKRFEKPNFLEPNYGYLRKSVTGKVDWLTHEVAVMTVPYGYPI